MFLRLVPLAAAAFFMISGAYALNIEPNGLPGIALLISGLIVLGAWLAVESWHAISDIRKPSDDDDPPPPPRRNDRSRG
jgi:hypothetical protein